ncbi:increased DNA methylation 1-like [Solanum pennellii]|uniref:Increased DNA methylation 1-like n=1 Tax=Solanum pennellii TaxID=28526 RepID=A0ABM1VHD4_SOLPN|nr:increased DNA methylation 1-like [Solanum pennellii]
MNSPYFLMKTSCRSNFNRVNFRGFHTFILEKDEEIISAATIRIHGKNLAEMPFIATNKEYRRKGMCKKLMVAIESTLSFLKVEKLVIPSVSKRIGTWIESYGFRLISSPLPKEITLHNTLMFHTSVRLQKDICSSASDKPEETQSSPKKCEEPRSFDLNVEASHQQDKD